MDITRRLIGSSAIISPDGTVTGVDTAGLIRRLLLFDKYILYSVRLQEFPHLAKLCGYNELSKLLSTALIDIRCECLQLAQIGQSQLFGDPLLPPLWFKFNWIDMSNRTKYIHDCLQKLHDVPTLKNTQVLKLKKQIVDAIRPLPAEIRPELFPAFRHEAIHQTSLVKKSVDLVLTKEFGISPLPFTLSIHQEAEDTFRAETDLGELFHLSTEKTHKIVELGLLGVAALSQSVGEMKAYTALSGFREDELPLFRHKLDFLASAVSSDAKERNFQRVIDLADLPAAASVPATINVDQLLRVRESRECREFRDWLDQVGDASDAEIKDRIRAFKAVLPTSMGNTEKLKILATQSMVSVSVEGKPSTALNIVDNFLFNKILPHSGIAAFVNELYPSIFEHRKQ